MTLDLFSLWREWERRFPDAVGNVLWESESLQSILSRLAIGPVGKSIDVDFESFDLTKTAKKLAQSPTVSNVMLGVPYRIIRWSELTKYELCMKFILDNSSDLRRLASIISKYNDWLLWVANNTMTLYRGMLLMELEQMATRSGLLISHPRRKYASKMDFVSYSIDVGIAAQYAMLKDPLGLLVEVDISNLHKSEYESAGYEARNDILVARSGGSTFRPYERFKGNQSGLLFQEAEIRIKLGSYPDIVKVSSLLPRSARFKARLERAVDRLGRVQGRKIIVDYPRFYPQPWQSSPPTKRRR